MLNHLLSAASVVRLGQPWWLLAGVAAFVPPAIAAWARHHRRHQRPLAVTLQSLAIVLAAVALARPALPLGGKAEKPYLVLRDVSASTRLQSDVDLSWPRDLPRQLQDFAAGLLSGGEAHGSAALQTNLGPALRLAVARSAKLAGVVVLTDGQFHDAAWRGPATSLGQSKVPVFIVPFESPPADARIAAFSAEPDATGRCRLRVTVAANAPAGRTLRVWRQRPAAKQILQRELVLLGDDSVTIRHTDGDLSLPVDAAAVYRAELNAGDAFAENDIAAASLLPLGQHVAVVAKQPGLWGKKLADALGLSVAEVPPADAPRASAGWMDYAGVVLVDASGRLLDEAQREAIAGFVRGGGGLLLVGAGPHDAPADREDPLNRVSALLANPYERKPLKLVVVVDTSGSMSRPSEDDTTGQIKFDLARQAVLALRRHLTASDAMAVITFSDRPRRIYDSGAGKIDFAAVRDALAAIRPSGPTMVIPALNAAASAPPSKGRDGLVLLVSDLRTEKYTTGDVDRLAGLFMENKLSLGVVATGSQAPRPIPEPLLELLVRRLKRAEGLRSTLVRRDRLADLAEVFAGFLREARGDAIRRGRFEPASPATLFALPNVSLPKLDAYVLSAAQPNAEVLANVGSDPLLARRPVGLGRSVTLALPLDGGVNDPWRRWRRLDALLAAAAKWTLRTGCDLRFGGKLRRAAGRLHLTLLAANDEGPMNMLKLIAHIQPLSRGETRQAPLVQTAPGQYEMEIEIDSQPTAIVVRRSGGRVVWREALEQLPPRELAGIGPHWENLRALTALTGGRIISLDRLPSLGRELQAGRYTPIWPLLVATALLFMLIEWAAARIYRREG